MRAEAALSLRELIIGEAAKGPWASLGISTVSTALVFGPHIAALTALLGLFNIGIRSLKKLQSKIEATRRLTASFRKMRKELAQEKIERMREDDKLRDKFTRELIKLSIDESKKNFQNLLNLTY